VKWNDCDLVGTASEISRALRDGPANGDAYDYYGRLMLECGRIEEATERLKMALAVEARMSQAKFELTRALALLGKWDEVWKRIGEPPTDSALKNAYWTVRMRMHGWQRDAEGALACKPLISEGTFETQSLVLAFMDVVGQQTTPDALTAVLTQFAHANGVARRRSFFMQLVVEIWASVDENEKALDALEASARGRLSDLAWLDHCPVIGSIRNEPRFKAVRESVAVRAEEALAILRVS
jgi:tetratricopeptide (TPR) repeat protein